MEDSTTDGRGRTVVLYEGTPGVRVRRPAFSIVGVELADLVGVAADHVARGASRIELCGGLATLHAAAVRARVGAGARVGLNRYGFESLELIAAYKVAFAAGDVRPAAFFYPAHDLADLAPLVHPDATFQPVASLEHATELGARLVADGVGLVELYGGLGAEHAAAVLRGADGAVPVGFVGYDV